MGYYITRMKEKIINIKVNNITQKQWSYLLLELNIMKKAWKPYGVDMTMSAPGLKKIIEWGTKPYAPEIDDAARNWNKTKDPKYKKLWSKGICKWNSMVCIN